MGFFSVSHLRNTKIRSIFKVILSFVFGILLGGQVGFANEIQIDPWEYNPGPDPEDEMDRRYIDIYAELPEYKVMSEKLMDNQKFRYAFGHFMSRNYFGRNKVKILFIGQDATHVAEASKQPGTSAFGARVQSIANYFGVDQSVATTNAFFSTIYGQYGADDHLVVETDSDTGEKKLVKKRVVDNSLWQISNGKHSLLREKREELIEWFLENNADSLKLIVIFGEAARDAFAEFLVHRGARVRTNTGLDEMSRFQIPESILVNTTRNDEYAVPLTAGGKDLIKEVLGTEVPYSDKEKFQRALKKFLSLETYALAKMVFSRGGVAQSGVLNLAQVEGYDLSHVEIDGVYTNSLKGLKLLNGRVIEDDVAFVESKHPSVLGKLSDQEASKKLNESFEPLKRLKTLGWYIHPDVDANGVSMSNFWHESVSYKFHREDIRPGFFEFGAPDDRRLSRSEGYRLNRQTIVVGSFRNAQFDSDELEQAEKNLPSEAKDPNDLWTVRPRSKSLRYEFDRGPGLDWAKLMVSNLDRKVIFEPKPGMKSFNDKGDDISFEKFGIDAYYTKTSPSTGFFGHYRGSFEDPKVFILADPIGLDDWNTSRALTGSRGQYLHGILKDMGIGDDYLILKTVPFGMDQASTEEWSITLKNTTKYRNEVIKKILKIAGIKYVFTDGPYAEKEMKRIIEEFGLRISFIPIKRTANGPREGLPEFINQLKANYREFQRTEFSLKKADIPRGHLTYWSRIWEGTGGDSVVDAQAMFRGGARAVVVPNWVLSQEVAPLAATKTSIKALSDELITQRLRPTKQDIVEFLDKQPFILDFSR